MPAKNPADIQKHVRRAEERLTKIKDSGGRDIGADFQAAVQKAGARDYTNLPVKGVAASYTPYDIQGRFVNAIGYSAASQEYADRFTLSKLHESIHAVQFSQVPALHIDFNNRAFGNVIPTPRDFIKLRILAEAQAQGLEAYMGALMWRQGLVEAPDSPAFSLIPPKDALEIMDTAKSQSEGLAALALKTMNKAVNVKVNGQSETLSNFDIHCFMALGDYKKHCHYYDLSRGMPDVIRLEKSDFRAFDPLLETEFVSLLIDEHDILNRSFDPRVESDIAAIHKNILMIEETHSHFKTFCGFLGQHTPAHFLEKSRQP